MKDIQNLRDRAAGKVGSAGKHRTRLPTPWWSRISNARFSNSNTWAQGTAFIWKGSQAFDRANTKIGHLDSRQCTTSSTMSDKHTFTANAITTLTQLGGLDREELCSELFVLKEGIQAAVSTHHELSPLGTAAISILEENRSSFIEHWWKTWTQPRKLGIMLRMHQELFGNSSIERQQLVAVTRHVAECMAAGMAHFDKEGHSKAQGKPGAHITWAKILNKEGVISVSSDELAKDTPGNDNRWQAKGPEALRAATELVNTIFKLHPSNRFIKNGTRLEEECYNIRKCTDDWPVLLRKTGAAGSLAMFAAASWDGLGLKERKIWDLIDSHSIAGTNGERLFTAPFSESARSQSRKATVCLALTFTLKWLPQMQAELNSSPKAVTQAMKEAELIRKIEHQKAAVVEITSARLQELKNSLCTSKFVNKEGVLCPKILSLLKNEARGGEQDRKTVEIRRDHIRFEFFAGEGGCHIMEGELIARLEKAAAAHDKLRMLQATDSTAIGGLLLRGAIKDLPTFTRGLPEGAVKNAAINVEQIRGTQQGLLLHVYMHMSGKPWMDILINEKCTVRHLFIEKRIQEYTEFRQGMRAHKLTDQDNSKQFYADSNMLNGLTAMSDDDTFCD